MKIDKIAFEDTNCFSPLFLDYLKQASGLKPFYNNFPSADNFIKNIEEKNFPDAHREVLYNVLEEQYTSLRCSSLVKQNIEKLRGKRTFTITTGHQLNIFTGPLYFIYKIVACINTANELKTKYPDYNFVPVYWMASEDHDFEEINHFNLFGKQYTWETAQKGPVGKFKPESLKTLLEELPEKVPVFENAYLQSNTLADATREFQIQYIRQAISDHGGRMTEVAEQLGLHRPNLYRKMRQLGMETVG
jgi:bacillithiol synthase